MLITGTTTTYWASKPSQLITGANIAAEVDAMMPRVHPFSWEPPNLEQLRLDLNHHRLGRFFWDALSPAWV